ncbi:hypothetical protein OZN62_07875 [Aurantiacibacter sp. MUD11]|nr:hypothetical protein [Aurantiacibacter sp. MUD11]WAT16863.1 hypothetical protein OZN62_07875 [Aurantiacibacter sp. MUD11]
MPPAVAAGMADERVFAATGRDWAEWKAHLDAAAAEVAKAFRKPLRQLL